MIELRYCLASDGRSPFEEWFFELDAQSAAKVAVALARLEQGNLSNAKGIGEGVLEYRLNWGPGYRVYFGKDGDVLVILLTGDTKQRQQKISKWPRRSGLITDAASRNRDRRRTMALTRSFKELVQRRAAEEPALGEVLLREGIDAMLTGDIDTGKAILRDYIKAAVGFEKLGEATETPPKSLIRMFGPRGNPQARNLFGIIGYLQQQAGIRLQVTPAPR